MKRSISACTGQKHEPALLTVKQAAEYLTIGKTKLYEMVEHGEIPVMRIGRAIRFSRAALDEWIEDCQQGKAG